MQVSATEAMPARNRSQGAPAPSARARAWRYGYDGRGRLETVTDTLNRVSTYQYDLADRESLLTLPGGREVRYRP